MRNGNGTENRTNGTNGTDGRRLRDLLDELHDPTDLACCFLRLAERRIKDWGVTLHWHTDFSGLVEINEANRGNRWFPLSPMFHPETYQGGQAFWMEGRADLSGEPVFTQAARCYRLHDGTLADEITSLRIFYDEPADKASATEACACGAQVAGRLSGVVLYSGGTWARRDMRGKGVAAVLPRISRMLASRLWGQDYTISLVDPVLIEKGVVGAYGYHLAEAGIHWTNSASQGDIDLALVAMDRQEMLRDLNSCMALGAAIPA